MYDRLVRHPFMSGRGLESLQASDLVEAMLAVELALVAEQEALGVVTAGAAQEIRACLGPDVFDIDAIAADTVKGGNAAIPFVTQAKAALPDRLKPMFHRGATSQDIVDSALMRLIKPRLERCTALIDACYVAGCTLLRAHRSTPMVGRTLMQQALPITFGAKVAGWLWGVVQADARLRDVLHNGLYVQFGGAVGVHSGLGSDGLHVMDGMARRLGLAAPLLPWHTDRQPVLALIGAIDAVAVAAEKIAVDVALMAQTELGELGEPAQAGVGESSSMPHKRNPVGCARIRAAARQIHGLSGIVANAAAQPLERGLGEWHAEWAPVLDAVLLVEGALETLQAMLSGLEVHAPAMRRNLALTGGAIMAEPATRVLSEAVGRDEAGRLARRAAEIARREQRDYAEVLLEDVAVSKNIDPERLRSIVDPALYIGSSEQQADRMRERLECN